MSDFSTRGQRRRIAYHEGGHVVTGRHYGLRIVAFLSEVTNTRPDGSTFKMWNGMTQAPWNTLTPQQQRVCGVAGSVAMCCWEAYRLGDQAEDCDWEPPLFGCCC